MSECAYCGEEADHLELHRMKCVAECVAEEQAKVLQGIADELKCREDLDDHLREVIDQLQFCADGFPDELGDELQTEKSGIVDKRSKNDDE